MSNYTAQKQVAEKLAQAGMTSESAAMHTAIIEQMIKDPNVAGLVNSAKKANDPEYSKRVIDGILKRSSELILENREMLKEIVG